MSTQLPFLSNGDDSFAVINACYTLTEQYRNILIDLGKEHQLSENEMLVLVHLAQYPERRITLPPAWMKMIAVPGSFIWKHLAAS